MQTLYVILLSSLSVFMILLILIQRGKGGGLAGAFGGMGGQSAFGTKAGDAFTKITVVIAVIWFLLCISSILALKSAGMRRIKVGGGQPTASSTLPAEETAAGAANTGASDAGTSNATESSAPAAPASPE